ncbi:5-carboxymethyl-2-hydroxymuconate Delta-isomerase [Pseudobacter ginsenosidimutans]|uniref:5-carboxymethyl-2-hydroxymuconate isomerase n=1 Tax=Pseudobacter ginsenosidimutans TaxID=661488 RepID=A0A4Q7N2C7_9BACT|nr:5-carboxymethyl-2-hydroxymuconate Delta-isomerase [Pseudobacter ginsenosidimutans]QEC44052.1 5-carboxymethyl-2-hydroxymuconate Delta-isomerase [Pseudobacter ginsenosidimutans]RZS75492.1 5-carboxymethyl-2-hydroxymuconate isomerase [Pseudobacter ginsenosidimutans]
MPHFVIECSSNVFAMQPAAIILNTVYDAADSSGLFAPNDIKVRINSYDNYKLGEGKNSFLHIYASIMEGRTTAQKAALSNLIIERLAPLLAGISFLSMNVSEFEEATYCNKSLINPLNTDRNRHF